MSYSSVSQGLQSCLEPEITEKRVSMLKLAPPCSNHSPNSECPYCNNSTSTNTSSSFSSNIESYDENPISPNIANNEHDLKRANKDSSESWSFLQSLSNISHCNNNNKSEESVYVHPKLKCSSSMLSAKSLEMCTESLGCETGSESSDDMSLLSLENNNVTSFMRNNNNNNNNMQVVNPSKRLNRGNDRSFPPPLASMSDLGGVQVRPRRGDGRLILEAVTSSSPPSFEAYFHAERSNGRLRLRLFENAESCCSDEEEEQEEEEEEEEDDDEEEEEGEEEKSEIMKNEECDFDDDEEEKEEEENVGNGEGEMGITIKFTTPSRCKESGRKRDIFGDGYLEVPSVSLCL